MNDLIAVLERWGQPRILVLGDLMLDRYVWGRTERVSPEAPVLVLQADERNERPGGSASVAALLSGLGADAVPVGVVGDDAEGNALTRLLERAELPVGGLRTEAGRPTTSKERLMGRAGDRHPQQIVRVDYECRAPIPDRLSRALWEVVSEELDRCEAVLISDYDKGVCTEQLIQTVISEARRRGVPVIVDPARGIGGDRYRGATLVTPNRVEASLASGIAIRTPEEAMQAGETLLRDWDAAAVIVTLDRDGMILARRGDESRHFPTRTRDVYDITGAGDMVLAVAGLCLSRKIGWEATVGLANLAAGLEVERLGVSVVSREDLLQELSCTRSRHNEKMLSLESLRQRISQHRRSGRKIVFTNGCFDLLHPGHTAMLREAAEFGDVLIVAVNSDTSVARLKGPERPLQGEQIRAAMLAELECVDHVVIFDTPTPHRLLDVLRPDVLVKGGTYSLDEVVGEDVVRAYGGEVRVTRAVNGYSTTRLIQRIREGAMSHVATDTH